MKKIFNFNRANEFDDEDEKENNSNDWSGNHNFNQKEMLIVIGVVAFIIIIGIIIAVNIMGKKDTTNSFLVSYDANGGTGTMGYTECRPGHKCKLKNNVYEKQGYNFLGWSTSPTETGKTYQEGDSYIAQTDTTLYAVWEIKTITILYDSQGGSGTMAAIKFAYGSPAVKLPENAYTRAGYTFAGWHIYNPTLDKWYGCTNKTTCTAEKNTTLGWYDKEEIVTYYEEPLDWDTKNTESDIIFYAQWKKNTYTIKYNLNGGTNKKDAPVSGEADSTVTLVNPTRPGYTFKGWTVSGTDASISDNKTLKMGTSDVTLTATWVANFADYIKYLYNDSSLRSKNSLQKDTTGNQNIRYVGGNPNNYVMFNGELWRVIGVFNVSNGSNRANRIKLVRDQNLFDASWDSSASKINNGDGINEWSNSDIKVLLNDYYAGNSTTCYYCNGKGQSKCSNSCSNMFKKMSSTAKGMIENAVWTTGGIQFGGEDGDEITTIIQAYNAERGSRSGKTDCKPSGSGGNCTDTLPRTTKWTGLVGLIYPSDYGYVSTNSNCRSDVTYNDACKSNNWLSQESDGYWTMTPRDSTYFANAGWYISSYALVDNVMSAVKGVRPSVYLKSSVKITDGDGSKNNPYKLAM